jgi:hypothetical protein
MDFREQQQKRKSYSPPTLTRLTPEQAKKLVANHNHCSEVEAADLLQLLRPQPQENEENRNEESGAATDQRKRSA